MRGGRECRPELFVEGKPKCLQGILSLVAQGHRARSQTGGSMRAPHSDTETEVLSSKVRPEGPCRTWPEGCREAQGSQEPPDPFPSSHLPHLPHPPHAARSGGPGPCLTYQHSDGAVEGAHGLQRLPAVLIPVLPLHAHGDEGLGPSLQGPCDRSLKSEEP